MLNTHSPLLTEGITTNTPANQVLAQELVSQIITSIEEAHAQSQTASPLVKRQTDAAVAAVLASVVSVSLLASPSYSSADNEHFIKTIGEVLTPVVVLLPILGPLVVEIDVALNGLVVSLDVVVAGLIVTLDSL